MTRISRDEFPNRAFQLAYFIHREVEDFTAPAQDGLYSSWG
jgi:hypothetical protein